MRPTTVLVTDGEQRAALALVRSLGRAGHVVHVCSARARSLAGASRHATASARVADALAEPGRFASEVAALVRRTGAEVVIPVAEPAMLALLAARDDVAATIPFPSLDAFRAISDKALLLQRAGELGIAVPSQHVAHSLDEALALAGGLRYPVVLKPARSVGEAEGARAKLGVSHAADADELRARARAYPRAAFPLLLQQRVVGPGVGIFLLVWEGRTVATFAHRRRLEKPPSGGVSVDRESVAADPALVRQSRALLDAFDWSGVAMVEYKMDAATGTPYLMEVNGRFWGSLQLAVDAGVDFPALLVTLARGEPAGEVASWEPGVRSIWEWGCVDHLLARLRHGARALALPEGTPSLARTVGGLLGPSRGRRRCEVLRAGDPGPFLRESVDWILRR